MESRRRQMKARGVERAHRECGLCDAPGAHTLARVAHTAVAPLVAPEEGGGGAVELVVVGLAGARVAGEREAYRDALRKLHTAPAASSTASTASAPSTASAASAAPTTAASCVDRGARAATL